MIRRSRLDTELVRRRLAGSRDEAQDLIRNGRVLVNGAPADKAARHVGTGDNLHVEGPPARFVSRGGEKLQAALEHFRISAVDARALDVGASTGGFTDCLLQAGARHVVAFDVGHGQLHPQVRHDPRVVVVEGRNIRQYDPQQWGADFDLVVADVSFISLTVIAEILVSLCRSEGSLVVLVKPQFEAGRAEVSRGRGVISDPEIHEAACRKVADAFTARGAEIQGLIPSPLLGGSGNREFLLYATVRERLPAMNRPWGPS
ncbi:MAG: TlyA family RNA methyltransferase [Ilumatobacteraceae bacterium]